MLQIKAAVQKENSILYNENFVCTICPFEDNDHQIFFKEMDDFHWNH